MNETQTVSDAAVTKKCPMCAEEILAEARKCKHCGEHLAEPDEAQEFGRTLTRMLGLFFIIAGLGGFFYFWQMFETSVEVPVTHIGEMSFGGGRVNNLGLMNDQRNYMFGCAFLTILGIGAAYAGRRRNN